MTTTRLYRPIGLKEMELIHASGWRAFPPRLSWQPIFYPVLNFEYARQIAQSWNTQDAFSGHCGFVTEFEVDTQFLSRYEVQNVGGFEHEELWIPSEDLPAMNAHISGLIQVSAAYYGQSYSGEVGATETEKGRSQAESLEAMMAPGRMEGWVKDNSLHLLAHWGYWQLKGAADAPMAEAAALHKAAHPHWPLPAKFELQHA